MTASLILRDTPLFYQPPKGPSVTFTLRYNHRTQRAPQTAAYGNVGSMWTHDWQSYVVDNNFDLVAPFNHQRVHLRGEGMEYYTAYDPPTYWRSRATLVKVSADPIPYERRLPNGTTEVFTLADRAPTLPQRKVFLTQVVDPQGLTLDFTYDAQFRLVGVTHHARQSYSAVDAEFRLLRSIVLDFGLPADAARFRLWCNGALRGSSSQRRGWYHFCRQHWFPI